jgi:hypothetical protein
MCWCMASRSVPTCEIPSLAPSVVMLYTMILFLQTMVGLDVLVHGEPERSDM